MGLLDGELQKMFGAAFGTILLDGRHYRKTETRDAKGNVTGTVTQVQTIKGYRETKRTNDQLEKSFADDAGILLILETYQGRVISPPQRGDVVDLDGRWVIGDFNEDAAHASWVCEITRE